MGVTVFLTSPVDGQETIDGQEARIVGEVVWIYQNGEDRKFVIPLDNVSGFESDVVEQEVDEVEYEGGRFTEIVTYME